MRHQGLACTAFDSPHLRGSAGAQRLRPSGNAKRRDGAGWAETPEPGWLARWRLASKPSLRLQKQWHAASGPAGSWRRCPCKRLTVASRTPLVVARLYGNLSVTLLLSAPAFETLLAFIQAALCEGSVQLHSSQHLTHTKLFIRLGACPTHTHATSKLGTVPWGEVGVIRAALQAASTAVHQRRVQIALLSFRGNSGLRL